MRKLLILATAALACACRGSYVMWVGMDENATVSDGASSVHFVTYLTAHADASRMAGRIRIGDEALIAGFEDPSGYVPPGQTAPSIVWEADFEGEHLGPYSDFELSVVDEDYNPIPGMYTDYQPIKIPDSVDPKTSHVKVYYDIGYFDDDYNFTNLATAEEWLDVLYNGEHIYEVGTLAAPIETPWRPLDYRTAIPEPSTAALALAGIILLFKRGRA